MYPKYQKQERMFPIGHIELPDTSASFVDDIEDPESLTGFTVHSSRFVVRAFLKGGLIDSHVVPLTKYGSSQALKWRVIQILSKDYDDSLDLSHHYYVLRRHGKIDFTLKQLLNPARRARGPMSITRSMFSKKLCEDLVKRYGTEEEVARRTHVPLAVLTYWLHE